MKQLYGFRQGDYAEACVIAAFLKNGWDVSLPISNSLPYDAILDRGHGLIRVQIKTGRIRGDGVKWYNSRYSQSAKRVRYNDKVVDLMAIFCPDNLKTYLLPIEMAANVRTLRLKKAIQENGHTYLYAKDFEL